MGIDFSQAILIGEKDNYVFDGLISSSGSQGKTMRFRSQRTNIPVVFKWYEPHENKGSTQFSKGTPIAEAHYDSWLNEKDFLNRLSVIAGIGEFYQAHRNDIHIDVQNGIVHFQGEKLPTMTFCRQAMNDGDLTAKIDASTTVFPFVVDKIVDIMDVFSGKVFPPVLKSGRPTADFANFFFDDALGLSPVSTYISGRTLDKVICEPFSEEYKVNVSKNLLESVSILHWFGIMHRDIKPENVIIRDDGKVFLVDFGIAQFFSVSDRLAYHAGFPESRVADTQLNRSNVISRSMFGSRLFSSPQSLSENTANPSDDMYSAGLLAAVLVSGKHPYLPVNMSFSDYITIPAEERKGLHRDLKRLLTDDHERAGLEAKYIAFVKEQSSFVSEISDLFHLDPDARPSRFLQVMDRLGIPLPDFPPFADYKECDESQITYRPRCKSETQIFESLKKVTFGDNS
ncbi:MAG: hypothetical protein ABIJ21_03145 [Nanoarchaeota archaeon]